MSLNLDGDFSLTPKEFILNQVKVRGQLLIDSYLWRESKIEYFEAAFGEMVVQLEATVFQDKLPPKEVQETFLVEHLPLPTTWWDHFKVTKLEQNRWYWRWLKWTKDPHFTRPEPETRTVSVSLERWVNYPEAQIVGPEFGKPYRGYTLTRKK